MAEPRPDSAPACEYLNVHEDAVAQVLAALPDDETLYDLSELFRVFWRFDAQSRSSMCSRERAVRVRHCAAAEPDAVGGQPPAAHFEGRRTSSASGGRARPCFIHWTTITSGPCWPSAWSMCWKNDGPAIFSNNIQ